MLCKVARAEKLACTPVLICNSADASCPAGKTTDALPATRAKGETKKWSPAPLQRAVTPTIRDQGPGFGCSAGTIRRYNWLIGTSQGAYTAYRMLGGSRNSKPFSHTHRCGSARYHPPPVTTYWNLMDIAVCSTKLPLLSKCVCRH